MKSVFLLAVAFLGFSAAQAQDFGTPLPLATFQNEPNLGVIYALASDADGMNYLLTYRTTLNDNDIQNLQPDLRWNIYFKNTQSYLFDWSDAHMVPKTNLIIADFELFDVSLLKTLLVNQGSAILVFANDSQNKPIYNLPIGDLCASNPDLFQNIDDSTAVNQCGKITVQQVTPASN
jgi:hypothetical protein